MSKATLTLRKAIWNENAQRSAIIRGLDKSANVLDEDLHENIDNSPKTGRTYRLDSLTERKTAKRLNAGFRSRRGTSTRVISGSTFHRASAPGEPPARRTSALYKGLKVRRVSDRAIRASYNKKYGKILDDPNRLNRPFFKEPIKKFRKEKFKPIMQAEINKLL